MSQAKCPSCGFGFDNHRRSGDLEGLRGRLLYGPERLIGKARLDGPAFDTCPNCGNKFPSAEFRFFGEFARAKIQSMGAIYAVVGLLVTAAGVSLWLASK
jgi:hypothetical protein